MTQSLLTVRYRVVGDAAGFRQDMDKAAAVISASPGLQWKIWGFDPATGTGLGVYLFETTAAAQAFAAGPILERLRQRPDVASVMIDRAPVDLQLSMQTGAAAALAPDAVAAAQ